MTNLGISSIAEALEAIKQGEFVIVMDNEDRENEGDLIMPAEYATEESLAFMIRYCSGVICAPATQDRINKYKLPLMVPNNTEVRKCKFTVSIDLKYNTSTGISAADRAATIRAMTEPTTIAEDFNRPGHVFPLLAQDGGVLARAGHTEAAIDLAKLAGCTPVGYLCEINDDRGRMMRRSELQMFAKEHKLHMITISDLIRYRCANETLIRLESHRRGCPTPFGHWDVFEFSSMVGKECYHALVYGSIQTQNPVLVHFVDRGIDGTLEAEWAKEIIGKRGSGIVVYSTGNEELIDISGELMASQSIFGMKVQVLQHFGVTSVKLLGRTRPTFDLDGFGVQIVGHVKSGL